MDLHVVLYVCAQRWNLDSTSYKEVEINTTTTNPALEYFGPTSVMGWTVSSRAAHILCGSVIGFGLSYTRFCQTGAAAGVCILHRVHDRCTLQFLTLT